MRRNRPLPLVVALATAGAVAFPMASVAAVPTAGQAPALLSVPQASQHGKARTHVAGWPSAGTTRPDSELASLRVSGPRGRAVKVQRHSSHGWRTVRAMHTSSARRIDVSFVLQRPGRWRLRVPATSHARGFSTAALSTVRRSVITSTGPTFSVSSYGAVGNGVADDTSAIQAAVTAAAAARGTVVVPAGTYRISRVVSVPGNVTVSGSGVIKQVTAGVSGLRITGSGVTVEGVTLTGRNGSPAYAGGEYGIEAQGSSGTPLQQVTVRNVTLSKWGAYGVLLRQVVGFTISGCTVTDVGYTGLGVLTGSQGSILNNTVDNITPGASGNAYGIISSYAGQEAESTDIVVRGNTVSRVFWEGIDAHGGSRLTIDGNTVRDSGDGIALAQATASIHQGADNRVTNNLIEDSSKRGIVVIGQSGVPRARNTISGNTVRRSAQSGLLAYYTTGLLVSNNTFQEVSAIGLFLQHDNANFQASGNTFTDMWSNSVWTAGIHTAASGGTNTGSITGNTLQRGTKQGATYLNDYGYYYRGGLAGISVSNNNFTVATDAPIAGEN